ncbi:MAG: DUF3604 domain-containing protein, partial [Gammaproteobacteria bacterium]|nr:DUF3604 domain-containing protein [Gammaproteobacteria bacterium]
ETYATTGTRMMVRFFAGWDFDDDDLRSRAPAFVGYEKGVPMGGDMMGAPEGESPTIMDIPEGTTLVHQERAYTSPIWYSPE